MSFVKDTIVAGEVNHMLYIYSGTKRTLKTIRSNLFTQAASSGSTLFALLSLNSQERNIIFFFISVQT